MSRFIKELDDIFKDIFKSVTSKKRAKPCLYLYVTNSFYITPKLHMLSKNSEHNVFTRPYKINFLDSVYKICGLSLETNLIREAIRTELYKIPIQIIKKEFECDSVEKFYRKICFLDFENNDNDEEFVFNGDFVLVYSDGDVYIGTDPVQLITSSDALEEIKDSCCSTQTALVSASQSEPIHDLEFEED